MYGLNRTRTMYKENGLEMKIMIPMDSPRLTVTPGGWYGSDVLTQIRHELRDARDISAAVDCNAVIRSYLISRRLCLLPEEVSAGRDGMDDFPETDCAAADSGAAYMNDLIFRRLSFPPDDDSAAVDYDTGAVGLDDLIFRRLGFRPDEFAGGGNPAADACDEDWGHDFPPHEFAATRIFRRAER